MGRELEEWIDLMCGETHSVEEIASMKRELVAAQFCTPAQTQPLCPCKEWDSDEGAGCAVNFAIVCTVAACYW